MGKTDTFNAQNTISRIERELYLNEDNPSQKVIKGFNRVKIAFIRLHSELDTLNTDLLDES